MTWLTWLTGVLQGISQCATSFVVSRSLLSKIYQECKYGTEAERRGEERRGEERRGEERRGEERRGEERRGEERRGEERRGEEREARELI